VVLAGGFCARGPARIPRRNYVLKNEMFARVGDNGGFVFLINAPSAIRLKWASDWIEAIKRWMAPECFRVFPPALFAILLWFLNVYVP